MNIIDSSALPLVSIIIPAYNSEKCIDRCLRSLTAQNYDNLEIIVVDDGSTDSTREHIRQAGILDDRIRMVLSENKGPSSARNKGLDAMHGQYVLFVDSDDGLEPDAVAELVTYATSLNVDLVAFDFTICDQNSRTIPRESILPRPFPEQNTAPREELLHLLYSGSLSNFMWSYFYKADIFTVDGLRFNTNVVLMEDALLFFQVLSQTFIAGIYTDKPLYRYSVTEGSQSRLLDDRKISSGLFAAKKIIELHGVPKYDGYNRYIDSQLLFLYNSSLESTDTTNGLQATARRALLKTARAYGYAGLPTQLLVKLGLIATGVYKQLYCSLHRK